MNSPSMQVVQNGFAAAKAFFQEEKGENFAKTVYIQSHSSVSTCAPSTTYYRSGSTYYRSASISTTVSPIEEQPKESKRSRMLQKSSNFLSKSKKHIKEKTDRINQKVIEKTDRINQKIIESKDKVIEKTERINQKIIESTDKISQKIDEKRLSVAERISQKIDDIGFMANLSPEERDTLCEEQNKPQDEEEENMCAISDSEDAQQEENQSEDMESLIDFFDEAAAPMEFDIHSPWSPASGSAAPTLPLKNKLDVRASRRALNTPAATTQRIMRMENNEEIETNHQKIIEICEILSKKYEIDSEYVLDLPELERTNSEMLLSDKEFQRLTGMSKVTFSKMQPWRQEHTKRYMKQLLQNQNL